ncbi:MAG: gamma-glutamyltransferase [bacterium]|nr:gamma-glutamyltransferase [bacterium]
MIGSTATKLARVALALALALVSTASLHAAEDLSAKQAAGKHGMVAAAHPLAAAAGVEMLARGGNAADAATAAAFALTVVEPFGSSIGGDGCALIFTAATGTVTAINYRCQAPASASYERLDYGDRDAWARTLLAAAVPGMVAGTCELHARHGRLPLATVMAPAIRYAEEGFTASDKLASIIIDEYAALEDKEEVGRVLLDDGLPLDAGARVRNPDLGRSLRLIAEHGPDAFYRGEIAKRIDAFMSAAGGLVRAGDLADYRARTGEPVATDYRGLRVHSSPPPFGGVAVLANLNVLARLPLDFGRPSTDPHNVHLMAEAMKGVSRDRDRVVGDPRLVTVPVARLLSEEYARQRAATVAGDRAVPPREVEAVAALAADRHGSTSHLSVVDADGNAVALTQTLGNFFGCGVMVPGTGILLNNQMKNFSGRRSSPNSLQPGKWMRSTQSPTILTRGKELILVAGSPGNYRIITTVVQVVVNFIDYKMTIWEAIDAPRLTSRATYPTLQLESRYPPATVKALAALGHDVELFQAWDLYFGGVQAIARDPASGLLTGAADRRRDGVALAAEVAGSGGDDGEQPAPTTGTGAH